MRLSTGDKVVNVFIYTSLTILAFVSFYPFWNSLVISFNVGQDTSLGGITFWPRKFTLDNYYVVLRDQRILDSFFISIFRTVAGTFLSIALTSMFAYGLAVKGVIGKKYYMIFAVITMYFNGGLIPFFLVNRELNLMNTFWVLVIPFAVSVFNMIIFRTFFREIPGELEESAKIDGCDTFGIFFRIILPLSGPVFATLGLFTAVFHWNDWFNVIIFIDKTELYPIQALLQQILRSNTMSEALNAAVTGSSAAGDILSLKKSVTSKSLTMATMIVATLPIIAVYPFVQKYFVKGVLVGSLKG
ncbi:MAG: carbohydrate ABC transporter permease [Candidatus Pristimantibacillus lignocellulolyticus]|uniref:Carbohydrate ABC transporter permease n=1 Tax=Candidatus Pristimantibacillus lignocellulolyticus TaxID=2994561 RepID=A0A9J6ZKP9_9BACL|nr:MAG: carbohydrate ABC transporter permease [Candidatus Pristimantibacillus lignocellulolyticus]